MARENAWEGEAEHWIAWARTPGHDVFGLYAPAFFEEIVPRSPGLTLEIGCGEGRVVRQLTSRANRVVGVDVSPRLAQSAREADAQPAYAVADATALPFANARFDTVVAYNSLQTMEGVTDMACAVAEAARVLGPSGRLCLCVAHPMTDVYQIMRTRDGGDGVAAASYFEHERVVDTVTKDGLEMTFHGWTYTIADYARALEDAGFVIERVREPLPRGNAATESGLGRWRRMPLFLFIRARKPGL